MRDIALIFRKFSNADMDSFADADPFDTDPDPAVHFGTDPDSAFQFEMDPYFL